MASRPLGEVSWREYVCPDSNRSGDEHRGGRSPGRRIPEPLGPAPNHPNPFNPTTPIAFDLLRQAHVQLVVYDLLGREVARLIEDAYPAGRHRAAWDARNMASGTYFYRIQAGPFVATRRLMLIK